MTKVLSISLLHHQVSASPAKSEARGSWLRWLKMIMKPSTSQIGFIASPLNAAVMDGELTATLAAAANVIFQPPVVYSGELHCLRPQHSPLQEIGLRPWLADDNTKEGA